MPCAHDAAVKRTAGPPDARGGWRVRKLRGPVFADYELVFGVPNGSILVAWDEEDAARLRAVVKPGVMVVTRLQEQTGIASLQGRKIHNTNTIQYY